MLWQFLRNFIYVCTTTLEVTYSTDFVHISYINMLVIYVTNCWRSWNLEVNHSIWKPLKPLFIDFSPMFVLCSCTSFKHILLAFHFGHKWTAAKYNDLDRMQTLNHNNKILNHNNIIFQKMNLLNYTVCILSVSVCTPTLPNLAPERYHSNTLATLFQ